MAKKYEEMCNKIIAAVGGTDNIVSALNCETRLRLVLKDRSLVKKDEVKAIPGIMGCQFVGEQFQIVIGQYVHDVYADFCEITGLSPEAEVSAADDPNVNKKSFKYWFNKIVVDVISGTVMPLLPIFVSAGIIKMLVTILGPNLLGIFPEDSDVITLLTFVGDAGFYFMPIFAAWSAARKFNTNVPIALFLCAVLIHPTLLSLVEEGTAFTVYGIPMQLVSYTSQFLPTILTVWIMSYVYKFFNDHIPNSVKMALVPTLTILVMLPLMLCILAPAGAFVGEVIAWIAAWLADTIGPLAVGLIGGLWYFLVGLGMDKALSPIIMNQFATYGYDNLFWLSAIMATYALMGVGVAYIIRGRKEDRSVSVSNAITLVFGGISEPTIFTTIWRFRRAMIYLFVGGFVGGAFASFLNVKAYTIGTGNILFFTVCAGGDGKSLVPGIICSIIAFAVSFVPAMIFGFEDKNKANAVKKQEEGS